MGSLKTLGMKVQPSELCFQRGQVQPLRRIRRANGLAGSEAGGGKAAKQPRRYGKSSGGSVRRSEKRAVRCKFFFATWQRVWTCSQIPL